MYLSEGEIDIKLSRDLASIQLSFLRDSYIKKDAFGA